MTYEQLQQVEGNTLVPRALIVEAVMARLKVHERQNAEELEESDNPRYVNSDIRHVAATYDAPLMQSQETYTGRPRV